MSHSAHIVHSGLDWFDGRIVLAVCRPMTSESKLAAELEEAFQARFLMSVSAEFLLVALQIASDVFGNFLNLFGNPWFEPEFFLKRGRQR